MKVMIMLSALIAAAMLYASPSFACDSCGCGHDGKHDGDHGMKHDGDHGMKHDGGHGMKHDGDHGWKHDGGHGMKHDGHRGDRHDRHYGEHGDCYGGGHDGYYRGHGVGPSRFSQETGEWLGGHGDGMWHERRDYGNDWHGSGMDIIHMEQTMHVATLHGMLDDNLPALFMQLMEEVMAQGLIGPDSHVGAVVPNAVSEDDMTKIEVWPGINVDANTVVAAPLQKHAIAPRSYALFVHVGPYDRLPDTWMAAFEYVHANGIELDPNGWALEQYVSDPMETPEDELITNIFLPLRAGGHGGGSGYNH